MIEQRSYRNSIPMYRRASDAGGRTNLLGAHDSVDLMRFQAVLHEGTGNIDVCDVDTLSAGNIGDNGLEATSGIQLDSATGFDYSCDTADLVNGLQLLYVPSWGSRVRPRDRVGGA